MSLKAKLEAIIYAAETPVTLDQLIELVKESVIGEGAAGRHRSQVAAFVWLWRNWSSIITLRITVSKFVRLPADIACRPSPSITTSCAPLPKA